MAEQYQDEDIMALLRVLQASAPIAGAATGGVGYALAAAPEVYKLITGLQQKSDAKKLEKRTTRPTYEIPKAFNEYEQMARQQYNDQRLIGQSQAEGRLDANFANGVNQMQNSGSDPNAILSAIAGMQNNTQNGYNDLAIAGANQQLLDQQNLAKALQMKSDYQDRAWDYNQAKPYEQAMATIGALRQGGTENIYSAGKGLASSAIGVIGSEYGGKANNPFKSNSTNTTAYGQGVPNTELGQKAFNENTYPNNPRLLEDTDMYDPFNTNGASNPFASPVQPAQPTLEEVLRRNRNKLYYGNR
jgi:hypothetical protein